VSVAISYKSAQGQKRRNPIPVEHSVQQWSARSSGYCAVGNLQDGPKSRPCPYRIISKS